MSDDIRLHFEGDYVYVWDRHARQVDTFVVWKGQVRKVVPDNVLGERPYPMAASKAPPR